MQELLLIAVGSAFVNNVVLSQFLGICPFLGVSKNVKTAAGMGGAVVFVITIASFVTGLIYKYILGNPNIMGGELEYLNTIVFILVIAALVQFVEMFLKKAMPPLYNALGVYLPLITTNCAVLGIAIINIDEGSHYLGEIALVPYDSAISNMKTLFYNTLYDENAACHLALGDSFKNLVKGYETMSKEEMDKLPINHSIVHTDFMIGNEDLNIVGTTIDGKEIQIFKNGDWAI